MLTRPVSFARRIADEIYRGCGCRVTPAARWPLQEAIEAPRVSLPYETDGIDTPSALTINMEGWLSHGHAQAA